MSLIQEKIFCTEQFLRLTILEHDFEQYFDESKLGDQSSINSRIQQPKL